MDLRQMRKKAEEYQKHEKDFGELVESSTGILSPKQLVQHIDILQKYKVLSAETKQLLLRLEEYTRYRARVSRKTKLLRRQCKLCDGWLGYQTYTLFQYCPVCRYARQLEKRINHTEDEDRFLSEWHERIKQRPNGKKRLKAHLQELEQMRRQHNIVQRVSAWKRRDKK